MRFLTRISLRISSGMFSLSFFVLEEKVLDSMACRISAVRFSIDFSISWPLLVTGFIKDFNDVRVLVYFFQFIKRLVVGR